MIGIERKYRIVMLVISGMLTSFALILPRVGFIQWVSIIPAALVIMDIAEDRDIKLRNIYGYGLCFFMSYYLVIYHWFWYMYPLDFAGLNEIASLAVVCVAWIGLSLLQTVGGAFVFVLFAAVSRLAIFNKNKILMPLMAAAIWTVSEWAQTIGWWGVPWGRLCLGQTNALLLLRSASVLGTYFVTFVIVAVNFFLAYALSCKEKRRIASVCAICIFGINAALGAIVTVRYKNEGEPVKVAAVQGNISSTDKWSGGAEKILEIHAKYTREAAKNGARVVVWSETALPYNFFKNERIHSFVSALARECNVTILVSTFTEYENNSWQLQNSLIEVCPDGNFGEDMYFKQRLVPFGEFVPMRRLVEIIFPPLSEIGMLQEDLIAGEESTVIQTDAGRFGCGICFDSIYEDLIRESVLGGAQIIAISTNDSWFADSAALYMHNSQSVLRAIENGRYVVRSANTGISSIIDPMGNLNVSLPANEEGYITDNVSMRDHLTVYTVIGNIFVYICAAAVCVSFCAEWIIKRRDNMKQL